MVAPTPYFADRGCHVRIYEEARALRARGHDVRIVTYHIGRDMARIPTYRIASVPWYRKLSAGPSWHKLYLDLLLLFRARAVAREFKPHLIHAHLHEGAFLGFFLKKLLRIPLLFDCQGSLTTEITDHSFVGRGSFAAMLFSHVERWINAGADSIMASSGPLARDLVANWNVPARKVVSVMDGVDVEVFSPHDRNEARRRLGIESSMPVIVFLGILNRYQGTDILLEAAAVLKEKGTKARFLVMGFPEAEYREKAAMLGLEDMVTFTGRIDYADAPRLLAAGDIAVSPKISRTEANGKLFNYLACSLPSVVFDTEINREILGETGTYAVFGDATDLAEKIDLLLKDPERRSELARVSRLKAEREHSWDARAAEIEQLYGDLI